MVLKGETHSKTAEMREMSNIVWLIGWFFGFMDWE